MAAEQYLVQEDAEEQHQVAEAVQHQVSGTAYLVPEEIVEVLELPVSVSDSDSETV